MKVVTIVTSGAELTDFCGLERSQPTSKGCDQGGTIVTIRENKCIPLYVYLRFSENTPNPRSAPPPSIGHLVAGP